jgi:hypothetical protein
MKPRYQYDCIFCKYNWNCGPVCKCVYENKLPDPPKTVKVYVNNCLISAGYEKRFILCIV